MKSGTGSGRMKVRIITSLSGLGLLIPAAALAKALERYKVPVRLEFLEEILTEKWCNRLFHAYENLAKKHARLAKFITCHYGRFASHTFSLVWRDLVKNTSDDLAARKGDVYIVFHGYASRFVQKINEEFGGGNVLFEMHTNWGLSPHWTDTVPDGVRRLGPPGVKGVEATGIPIEIFPMDRDGRGQAEERILLMGGGWGLGNLLNTISSLRTQGKKVRVAIGDNFAVGERIINKFPAAYANHDLQVYSLACSAKTLMKTYGQKRTPSGAWYPKIREWDGRDALSPFVSAAAETVDAYPPFFYLKKGIDTILTKPGGLTLSEAGTAGMNIYLLPAMNIQEQWNRDVWLRSGAVRTFDGKNACIDHPPLRKKKIVERMAPASALPFVTQLIRQRLENA